MQFLWCSVTASGPANTDLFGVRLGEILFGLSSAHRLPPEKSRNNQGTLASPNQVAGPESLRATPDA